MNAQQKKILIATIVYVLLWNTQYFFEQLSGPSSLIILLILLIALFYLISIALFLLVKFILKKPKNKFSLINIGFIFLVAILSWFKPFGIIDFYKFEGENILIAMEEGSTYASAIRLKEGNIFKKTTTSFGIIDHQWGNYTIVNDTIKFHYNDETLENKEDDYAILKLENDFKKGGYGELQYFNKGGREDGRIMDIFELKKGTFEL